MLQSWPGWEGRSWPELKRLLRWEKCVVQLEKRKEKTLWAGAVAPRPPRTRASPGAQSRCSPPPRQGSGEAWILGGSAWERPGLHCEEGPECGAHKDRRPRTRAGHGSCPWVPACPGPRGLPLLRLQASLAGNNDWHLLCGLREIAFVPPGPGKVALIQSDCLAALRFILWR